MPISLDNPHTSLPDSFPLFIRDGRALECYCPGEFALWMPRYHLLVGECQKIVRFARAKHRENASKISRYNHNSGCYFKPFSFIET